MEKKPLRDMSYEELEKVNQDLMRQRKEVRDLQLIVKAEMDKKAVNVRMKAKAATLSDSEKAALAQVLRPKGIVSEEAHGEIGGK